MGWSYPFWVGNFYPYDLAREGFLGEYAKHFETVEADSTYYGIPRETAIREWHDGTPEGFIFSAKFPKRIPNDRRFRGAGSDADAFVRRMDGLGGKLGPLLIQLPHDFKPEEMTALADFLDALPGRHRYVVEARGPLEGLPALLGGRGVAIASVDELKAKTLDVLTTDFAYVRLEGNKFKVKGTTGKVEADRGRDLAEWASRLRALVEKVDEVFVYCSKYYSGHSPTDALALKRLLANV